MPPCLRVRNYRNMFLTICLNPTIQKTLCFDSIVPGTVNRTANHRFDVSGKGINVTRVLTQLGKKVVHLTQLGGDMRPLFLSLCEQDELSVDWVESNSQIRFCYTLLTPDDVTELVEESESVAAETEKLLLEKFDKLIGENLSFANCSLLPDNCSLSNVPCSLITDNCSLLPDNCSLSNVHCLIISGTKAAGFSDTLIPDMVRKAKEKGIGIVLDIKGNDLIQSLKHEPDIVKPNLFEFASSFAPQLIRNNNFTIEDIMAKEQIKSIMLEMAQKYRCCIILTNGSREIIAADKKEFFEIKFEPVRVVNSIGCGDAFTAGLAAALFSEHKKNSDLNIAINEGIRCGSLNAGLLKPGVIR